jgi:hypothetical protein
MKRMRLTGIEKNSGAMSAAASDEMVDGFEFELVFPLLPLRSLRLESL